MLVLYQIKILYLNLSFGTRFRTTWIKIRVHHNILFINRCPVRKDDPKFKRFDEDLYA